MVLSSQNFFDVKKLLVFLTFLPAAVFGQSEIVSPELSHPSGFYPEAFHLTISHPDSDVVLLYTLDGSVPDWENIDGKTWTYKKTYGAYPDDPSGVLYDDTIRTRIYQDELMISDRSHDPDRLADIAVTYFLNEEYRETHFPDKTPVFKGTVLRVAAYKGGAYSEVVTRNYFITEKEEERYSLPVICLNLDPDGLFDYETGWNVPGKQYDDWRTANPEKSAELWTDANFREKGDETELEINFTYLVDGEEVLNHGAGLRANGNSSRIYPNRSLRLYAKSGYGPKNFNYPFFEDYSVDKFKRLILRNGGQDTEETMFRDALIQQAAKDLHCDIQEYQPVIVFINGEYWGLYNLRERYDKKYFDRKHGVDEDELDFIKAREVKEGDEVDFLALNDFLENNSPESADNYQVIREWVDIENVIDYFAIEIFAGNVDWPQSNVDSWRKRVPYDSLAPYGHDGRWRWILKDLDYSLGKRWDGFSYSNNDLKRVTTVDTTAPQMNKGSLLLRRLLENEDFEMKFISRFADLMNSAFREEVLSAQATAVRDKINGEMEEFIARWNPGGGEPMPWSPVSSYEDWQQNARVVMDFAENRQAVVRNHLIERFDLGSAHTVTVDISPREAGHIRVNTLDILDGTAGVSSENTYPWSGQYFEKVPVRISAVPQEGFVFSHWTDGLGNVIDTTETITHLRKTDILLRAHFAEDVPSHGQPPVKDSMVVYPNPFTNLIFIDSDDTPKRFYLYSIRGELVRQGDFKVSQIHTDQLPAGIYMLQIETGHGTVIRKMVKM